MGTNACVIGIGLLSEDLKAHMDYPIDYYKDVAPGTPVGVTFFQCSATDSSRELAEAFGIGDPWNFGKHAFNKNSGYEIDWPLLDEIGKFSGWDEEEIEAFEMCLNAGFMFVYMPNG